MHSATIQKRIPTKTIVMTSIVVAIAVGACLTYVMLPKTSAGHPFKDICEGNSKYYSPLCAHVGMYAHSLYNVHPVNRQVYGQIKGVSWRRVGSIISRPGEIKRYAPNNDYHYIVCPEGRPSYCMLQPHREVKPIAVR